MLKNGKMALKFPREGKQQGLGQINDSGGGSREQPRLSLIEMDRYMLHLASVYFHYFREVSDLEAPSVPLIWAHSVNSVPRVFI